MSGGKETPRQKMIGMMYLVLTALLALNVSKEILNAFVIVEDGLNKTNDNFDGKNGVLYSKFEKAMADNKVKTEPWYKKAMEVKKSAAELCKMVDDIRSELYMEVQKLPSKQVADTFKLTRLDSKDNFDIPTHYLLGNTPEEPGSDAKVLPLKKALIDFKKKMLEIVPPKEKANLKLGLNTDDVYAANDEKMVHWEYNNFDHTTMAADMCIFAGIKNDIKNAESDVVGLLLKAITADDFSFDAVEAKVVANANYITAGEDYTADIFVSAHSSTQNPEIVIGNVDTTSKVAKLVGTPTTVPVTAGVGKYVVHTGAEGDQEYSGLINVKAPDGSVKPYPFHGKYTVAKPSMAVSPTKMNVFYIGVDNPVDISVAGTAPMDVSATLSGGQGSIKSLGGGHYIVNVKSGDAKGMINVNVSKKTKDGNKSAGPPMVFRVKKVPSPQASFAGVTGDGKVTKGELMNAGGVIPKLEDFVFDLKFPVVSWNMSVFVNGVYVDYTAQGASCTGQMKDIMGKVKTGQKVLIEEVKVQAPDGVRKIVGCVLKIK
ncbi:MAG: type IX secretion system motor protein PorM/GldM [Bacteroidia bacterium]